jgi:hypothetical protein
MNYIPSLEPRGSHPRSNPSLVRLFELIMAWGAIRFVLRILDMSGEGEAAVHIYNLPPHTLQFLGSPVFSGLAIVAGFAGLIWQAARQAARPKSIPEIQIVHPVTKLLISSKPRIWPKIRRPTWTCVIAAACSVVSV